MKAGRASKPGRRNAPARKARAPKKAKVVAKARKASNAIARRTRKAPKAPALPPAKSPRLDRVRRTLDETVQTPPSSQGVEYEDSEELHSGDKAVGRDVRRWELDPASAEDDKEAK